jgi:hypothetical protein
MIIFLAAIKKNVPGGNNKGKKRNYEFDVDVVLVRIKQVMKRTSLTAL